CQHPALAWHSRGSGLLLAGHQPARPSWNFGAPVPSQDLLVGFSYSARERSGEVAASCLGILDWRLSAGFFAEARTHAGGTCTGLPEAKESRWWTARTSLRPADVRWRVGA